MTDEQLMAHLQEGNESAFNELYSRYGNRMYGYFYRMLYQDKELAADFTQNLFLKIFEKAKSYNSDYNFSTWIYTIASNMCKNEYRRQSKPIPIRYLQQRLFEIIQPKGPRNVDQEIFRKHLQNALNELDDKQKQCFALRFQEDLSVKEISEIMDCPEGTIKSRLHYTLKKLSEKLVLFKPSQKEIKNGKRIK